MNPFDVRGRRVLVTGSTRGIGAAVVRLLSQLGAEVIVHGTLTGNAGPALVAELRAAGGRAELIRADLTEWAAGEALVAASEDALGPLDGVVLNHGVWYAAPLESLEEDAWRSMARANLDGFFSVGAAAAKRMKARGAGTIVLVSSTAGQRGEAFHSTYAATKGAIISMTKSWASELAPAGVRVNCVAPGWVATPMTVEALENAEVRASVEQSIPLRRVARPEEIAAPIAFLLSDAASFMHGEIMNVNGGAVLVG